MISKQFLIRIAASLPRMVDDHPAVGRSARGLLRQRQALSPVGPWGGEDFRHAALPVTHSRHSVNT
jgi:hypothetical protein